MLQCTVAYILVQDWHPSDPSSFCEQPSAGPAGSCNNSNYSEERKSNRKSAITKWDFFKENVTIFRKIRHMHEEERLQNRLKSFYV